MARFLFGGPTAVIVGALIALACSDEKRGPTEPGRLVAPATLESDLKEYCDALFPGTSRRTSERNACAGKVKSLIKQCVQKQNPESCQDHITELRMFTDDLFDQLLDPPYPPLPTAEGGDETFTSKVLAVNEFYELLNLSGGSSGAEGGDQAVAGPGDQATLDCGIGTLHIPMGTVDEPTLFQCTPLEGLNLNTTLPQFVFQMDASSNPQEEFNKEVEICLTHLDPPAEGSPPGDALGRLRVALDGLEFTIATPGTGEFCPTSEGLNAASPGEVSGKLSKLRSPTGIVDPGFTVENQDGIVVEGFVDNGEPFGVGETITYRVVVTNETSGTTMTNVVADISLLSGGTIVACDSVRDGFPTQGSVTSDDCTDNDGSGAGLTWAIGTILPGESAEIQYDATAVSEGTDINRVVVTSDHFEGVHVTDEETVVLTPVSSEFASVSAGYYHSCGVTTAGAVYCWGDNEEGGLGDGTNTDSNVPVAVSGSHSFASVKAGTFHSCGVTTAGAAYCWGLNENGQLGDGTTNSSTVPVAVSGGHSFAFVSASLSHTCGVTTAGAAYCWGLNHVGQLGDGTTNSSTVPVAVSGSHSFSSVSAGHSHGCGLTTAGAVYCWGDNGENQFGNGTSTSSTVPVAVSGGHSFASLGAGWYYNCGVTPTGAAYCWGRGDESQLGNGTNNNSSVPVAVSGGHSFASLGVGALHSCGVTTAGAAYCWGFNGSGGLGDGGSLDNRSVPVAVSGGHTFASVSAGYGHSCGVTAGGVAYCWGFNGEGGLGNGTNDDSNVPVAVSQP